MRKLSLQPFKEELNILTRAFLKPVPQSILPKNGLSLGWEQITTQHNVLEMLFLDSVLMIVIVTNHAWEPVSQDLVLLIT